MTGERAIGDRLLAQYPVLRDLADDDLARLLQGGQVREVPAGTVMFDVAQPCTGFPFVLAGAIGVGKASESGREIQLYRVEAGDSCILSSTCLLGSVAYDAHGVALVDSTVFMVPRPVFERLLATSEQFRRYVFGLFAARIADLMQTVEAVAFKRLDQRLAALLLQRGPQAAGDAPAAGRRTRQRARDREPHRGQLRGSGPGEDRARADHRPRRSRAAPRGGPRGFGNHLVS